MIEFPNRFSFPIENSGEYGTVTKEMVDDLTQEEYWVLDAYDDLGDYFPSCPDVPPSEGKPTDFVAIPKNKVIDVYTKYDSPTNYELKSIKQKYYQGEITLDVLKKQIN